MSFSSSSEETMDSDSEDSPQGLTIPVPTPPYNFNEGNNPPRSFHGSGSSTKLGLSSTTTHIKTHRNASVTKFDGIVVKKSNEEKCKQFCTKLFRRKNIERTFPILKWAPKYNIHKLLHDTIAGFTVALTVLPQSLAYATVAGLPPLYGLYSSFWGPFVYIIFGSTAAINVGPSAIQSILTYKYTVGKPEEYAIFLTAVTAIFTLLMGIFRLGFVASFISAPVISAFTSGVALTIISTQLKPLLGLSFPSEEFVETIQGLIRNLDKINKHDALLGLTCCVILIIMMYLQKLFHFVTKRCPSPILEKVLWFLSVSKSAVCMLGSTFLVAFWYPDQPFSIVGYVSPGLPSFQFPPTEIWNPSDNKTHSFTDILKEEASALFVVPLLGVISHCSLAKVFSGSERVDNAQEILVLGISNAVASCFSSMPIGGSFSRTTVNIQSGVKTPMGGLITGILVILALEYLTPYFFYIPKASIAAVICISCLFMVNPYVLIPLWRSKKMDLIPFAVTFLTTLFVGLEYGILVGILISALFLLFYSARPRVKVGTKQTPKGTSFVHILLDRSLTFPSVDYISNQVIKAARQLGGPDTPVVIDCHHIQYADFTAAEGMRDLIANMNHIGYQVFFWKVKPSVFRVISGTFRHTDFPLFRCNNEEELDAVLDGVHRRLSMFHPFVIRDGCKPLPKYPQRRKTSDTSVVGTAASAFSTGVVV